MLKKRLPKFAASVANRQPGDLMPPSAQDDPSLSPTRQARIALHMHACLMGALDPPVGRGCWQAVARIIMPTPPAGAPTPASTRANVGWISSLCRAVGVEPTNITPCRSKWRDASPQLTSFVRGYHLRRPKLLTMVMTAMPAHTACGSERQQPAGFMSQQCC